LENTLERRKDMLYKASIIPHLPPFALKIIKFYSIFQKTPPATRNQGYSLPLPTQNSTLKTNFPPPATKIIKNYSKFPKKKGLRHGLTQFFATEHTEGTEVCSFLIYDC
jgi:hypothetical protein